MTPTNKMYTLLAALLWSLSSSTLSATSEFAVGQVWAYNTRPGEEQSTLVIDKVEDDTKLGRIYHISVSGIQIKVGVNTFARELPHLPVSLGTLKMSCTTLVGQAPPNPNYLPGYRLWKEAHDAGHAGVYTISVADIVAVTEKTLQTPEAHN
jgi:hypothetical protein